VTWPGRCGAGAGEGELQHSMRASTAGESRLAGASVGVQLHPLARDLPLPPLPLPPSPPPPPTGFGPASQSPAWTRADAALVKERRAAAACKGGRALYGGSSPRVRRDARARGRAGDRRGLQGAPLVRRLRVSCGDSVSPVAGPRVSCGDSVSPVATPCLLWPVSVSPVATPCLLWPVPVSPVVSPQVLCGMP
jgi:hypothetical protein